MSNQATAYQKFIRQSPRKMRLVADAIRGQKVLTALDQLTFMPKRAAETIHKVLNQAVANAVSANKSSKDDLHVSSIVIEEGPRIKRWRPVSRGMAHSIIKRTSHIKITVEAKNKPVEPKKDK